MTTAAEPRRPAWERRALALLLAATAAGYLVNLDASPYANTFYAAAVRAGSASWKAFFFGSLDPANLVTVDKPPASLWVMDLSARIFGFSTWSLLVPQVLMAVAAVGLLHATVRRVSGPVPGLVAGALLAATPVVVLMFRYDNPDALLVLLMTLAGYTTVRAVGTASTRWLLLTGAVVGAGFLAKELQAFLAVPGLALAYLWAAPTTLARRIVQLLGAGVALVVAAGWWVLAVALWPAADRPYIGGSSDNSELGRALGYNGLSRLLGGSSGAPAGHGGVVHRPLAPPPAAGVPGMDGGPGFARLFSPQVAGHVAWLLPAALVLLVAGLWVTRRAPRTDLGRAALLLFGSWLLVGAAVLSAMQGLFHPYYALVLAPPIAGLVAVGGALVARRLPGRGARALLAVVVAGTGAWSGVLLGRTPSFAPGLADVVLAAGLLAAVALLLPRGARGRVGAALAGTAVLAAVTGPVAYAADTVATPHSGASVTAGPALPAPFRGRPSSAGEPPAAHVQAAHLQAAHLQVFRGRAAAPGRLAGPPRVHERAAVSPALAARLRSAGTRWSAATPGSSAAASLELATGTAVMGIGGYSGTDPVPTLDRFRAYVAAGEVRYFLTGNQGGGYHGWHGGVGAQISAWVARHYRASTVSGETVYDLLPRPGAGVHGA